MPKKIRDAVCDLEMSICKMSDSCVNAAKSHALESLDGSEISAREARRYKAMSDAYHAVIKLTTELRIQIEKGEVA